MKASLMTLVTLFAFGAFAAEKTVEFTTARTAPSKVCDIENYDACFADTQRAMWAFSVVPKNPVPVAVLLIQGLSDSPYLQKDVARVFAERGFPVVAIRLSGMGTTMDALHFVRKEQWIDDIHYGLEEARKLAPRVIVGGLSLGGYLSAHLAEEMVNEGRAHELAGVALFSPALKLPFGAAALYCGKSKINPFSYMNDKPYKSGGGEYVRYMNISSAAVCEFAGLYQHDDLLGAARMSAVPLLTILSQDDGAVDQGFVKKYNAEWAGPKELLYYQSRPRESRDMNLPYVTKANVVVPLDHSWVMLKPSPTLLTGQINPDFNRMEEALGRFIDKVLKNQ